MRDESYQQHTGEGHMYVRAKKNKNFQKYLQIFVRANARVCVLSFIRNTRERGHNFVLSKIKFQKYKLMRW